MYTPEMLDDEGKPKTGPKKLTPQEAAWQRALAKRQKSQAQFLSSTSDDPQAPREFLSSSSGTNTRTSTAVEDDTEDLKTLKIQIGSFSDYQQRAPTPVPSDDEIDEMDYFQARVIRQAKKKSGRAGGLGTVGGARKTDTRVARSHTSKN
jgi:hypothetical protein